MNTRSLVCLIVSLGLLICVNDSSFAKGRKSTSKAEPAAAAAQTTITAVTPNSVTIHEGPTTKTLALSPVSEITVNGQKATVADLKVGMVVSVVLSDPTHASRIAATSGPAK